MVERRQCEVELSLKWQALNDRSGREADLHDDVAERPQWVDCGRSLLFERGHLGIRLPRQNSPRPSARNTFSAKALGRRRPKFSGYAKKRRDFFTLRAKTFSSYDWKRSLTH